MAPQSILTSIGLSMKRKNARLFWPGLHMANKEDVETKFFDDFPFRIGAPLRKLSELQKWEAPDPGYWVQYGYAVANVDPRSVGNSEGNIYQFGSQEGRDGADVVDWIRAQPWCFGKVGLSGTSYLAISQVRSITLCKGICLPTKVVHRGRESKASCSNRSGMEVHFIYFVLIE